MEMKKYMILFGLFMLQNLCNGQTVTVAEKTTLEEYNLKGKVKTINYQYDIENFGYKRNYTLYFDENGMQIKLTDSIPHGKRVDMYDNYIYAEGYLQSFDRITIEANKPPPRYPEGKTVFEYDSLGLLISVDAGNGKTVYRYDEKGNRIGWRIYEYPYNIGDDPLDTWYAFNAEGQVIEQWGFLYEEEDNEDTQENQPSDIKPPKEVVFNKYEYNELGDVICIIGLWSTDTINLVYDEAGNWIERIVSGFGNGGGHYLTTEDIYTCSYTNRSYHGQRYTRRIIEYYD
jgi:YD repeat-containing protein